MVALLCVWWCLCLVVVCGFGLADAALWMLLVWFFDLGLVFRCCFGFSAFGLTDFCFTWCYVAWLVSCEWCCFGVGGFWCR